MPIYIWCKECHAMVLKELGCEYDHTPNATTGKAIKEALDSLEDE